MKNLINKITNIDCFEGFKTIEDKSIDLIVTSPPYNLGIEYDMYNDRLPLNEYLKTIEELSKELFRIVKDDGRICINIAVDGKIDPDNDEKIDILYKVKDLFYKTGFKYREQIFWDKENLKSRTAWGSFESASCPNVLLPFEVILVFYKVSRKKYISESVKEMINSDFSEYTNGHWKIKGEKEDRDNKQTCPVPFPQELVKRLIQLYSYRNDLVLDPFSGNGTTCIVAKKLGRQFIGFEISENYYNASLKKLKKVSKE